MNLKTGIWTVAVILLLSAFAAPSALAQDRENDYAIGNRLLQQQEYEEAHAIFDRLHRSWPDQYRFLEKTVESLVGLKRYEEAIRLSDQFLDRQPNQVQAVIQLGKVHHISGATEAALDTWNGLLERTDLDLQHYLVLAGTMRDRRMFDEAITVYRKAAATFRNTPFVTSEIANTHLMAGNYEEAMDVYLQLLDAEPTRIDDLQTTLLRYNDEYLYDIAILEIEDFLPQLADDSPVYQRVHQLHLWLLMERQLYERALATALRYEERRAEISYSLYSIGRQLASERKFDLAEQAFRYYIDHNERSVQFRSMHELAKVYIEWGDYLKNYNLNTSSRRDSLYGAAFDLLDDLQGYNSYSDIGEVMLLQAELALDYLHRPEAAQSRLQELRSMRDTTLLAGIEYLEGRILLYDEEYDRARIALTRSNKRERIGSLAEKTRYYLALCDFYAGDFEFAGIQLNALERQSTSWFANDAVRLRVWIQEGLQADSSGALLREFAGAVWRANHGKEGAADEFRSLAGSESYHPLKDDALLQLALHADSSSAVNLYLLLDRYVGGTGTASPLRERLMWEKARIADQLVTRPQSGGMAGSESATDTTAADIPQTPEELIRLYEEILLAYPGGFYGSHSRNRIQELQTINT